MVSGISELGRAALGIVLGLLWAASAAAQPIAVTNLDDSGAGSLRQAIIDANASAGPDEIEFAPGLTGPLELDTALPAVTDDLEIRVDSAQLITVRAPTGDALFDVATGTTQVTDLSLAGGPIKIGTDSTFTFFQQMQDATFGEAITDAGGLRKEGDARLTLSGTNTYTGGTVVAAGELVGTTGSLQGDITNDAVLVFDQAADGTYSGVMSGTGNVVKRGDSDVTFGGENDYTGGTIVEAGTLSGSAQTIPSGVTVEGGATLHLTQVADDGEIALSGDGILLKDGGRDLTLTGNDTVPTATVSGLGSLIGSAASIPDSLTLAAGSTIEFLQEGSGTQQGSISGDGSVLVEMTGADATLTLRGINDYSGGTSVAAGGLIGDADSLQGQIDLSLNTSLEFDQDFSGTFDGTISGIGSVQKSGEGTLVIPTDQEYTGLTTISAGEISLLADLDGPVDVLLNGALSGTGLVRGDLMVEGQLAPGTSVGTLSVRGDVNFEADSIYSVEVEANGDSDQLAVTAVGATVQIATGSGLEVDIGPGAYETPVDFDIVTASAGDVQGSFDILTNPAFLDLSLDNSSPTAIVLTVAANDATLADFAQTPNQLAVAEGLETASGGAEFEADFDEVLDNLQTLSEEEIPDALDAIGGEQLAPFATQRLAIARRFNRGVDTRMETLHWREWESFTGKQRVARAGETRSAPASGALAVGALAVAQAGSPTSSFAPAPRESGVGGWLDAYGLLGSVDGNFDASTVDYQIAGANVALDYRFLDEFLVGIAGGYARTHTELKQLSGDGDVNTGQVGLYLGQVTPRYYVDVAGRFGYSSVNTDRDIAFASVGRNAKASFDGLSYGAHLAGGLNVADFAGVVFQPVARFDYGRLYRESFTEKNADSLDLSVASEKLDSIVTQVGVRLFGQFDIGEGTWFMPELRARWMHEFGDTERAINARLAGATTGGSWQVSSVSWPRDTAVLGIGWTLSTRNHLQLYLDYDATLGSGVFENGVGAGLRIVW